MVDSMYPVTVLVFLAVLVYVLYQHWILRLKTRIYREFNLVLIITSSFILIDCIWGVFATGAIRHVPTLIFFTYLFHLSAIIMSYCWFGYTLRYLEVEPVPAYAIITLVPALVSTILLFTNIKLGSIFEFDKNLVYHPGSLRHLMFVLEFSYYIVGVVIVVRHLRKTTDKFKRSRLKVVLTYMILLLVTGMFQFLSSNLPWYSIGAMMASLVAFLGNVLIERENELKEKYAYYMAESNEMNEAMAAMAESYLSIHVIQLEENISHWIRSRSSVDAYVESDDGADVKIKNVMGALVHPSMVKDMLRFVDFSTLGRRMKDKHSISREFMDIHEKWCLSTFITVQSDVSGNPLKIIHAVQDIDEAKKKEMEYQNALKEALENQNVIYSEMLKMQAGGIVAVDRDGQIIVCNDAAAKMFGYNNADGLTGKFRTILEEKTDMEDLEQFKEDVTRVARQGGEFSYTFSIKLESGKTKYFLANAKDFKLNNGDPVLITSLTDITHNREMEKKLIILSETDALTGINNRGSGEQKTIIALEEGTEGMFCLIDANRFKHINDTYGHQVGDKALIAIAGALTASFRDVDIVMRLGGDEFAVFAKNLTDKKSGEDCINRFFDNINAIDIEEMNGDKISVSLGATFSGDLEEKSFSSLYNTADSVMYLCKSNKDRCSMAFYEVH